jgi:hypothetical protein
MAKYWSDQIGRPEEVVLPESSAVSSNISPKTDLDGKGGPTLGGVYNQPKG